MAPTLLRGAALAAAVFLGLSGCFGNLNPVEISMTAVAIPGDAIPMAGRASLDGVYAVMLGGETFGDSLVVRWSPERLCLYSGSEVIFCETAGSMAGATGQFNGYWRFVRSTRSGALTLKILPDEGGAGLLPPFRAGAVVIRGTYNDAGSGRDVLFTRVRPFDASALDTSERRFQIMGNCGGGRNSERLDRSENSIEMARFASVLGCTGIEIDLRVTQDDEVIVFHDGSFSPRTIESTYILGDVQDFTLRQIRRNARLIHGEAIPTLDEYLTAVVDETKLEVVWLDLKVGRAIDKMIQSQQRAMQYARDRGRRLEVLIGIPTTEVLDAYRAARYANTSPVLCELGVDVVHSLDCCKVWAPQWTAGLQSSTVAQLRGEGKRVYPWTFDSPAYMTEFLEQSHADGILSNYPSMLTGLFYQLGHR